MLEEDVESAYEELGGKIEKTNSQESVVNCLLAFLDLLVDAKE
jgi:hypothetical protein